MMAHLAALILSIPPEVADIVAVQALTLATLWLLIVVLEWFCARLSRVRR